MIRLTIKEPSEKQKEVLRDRHKYIGYGGARGGGKSWAVRTKAKLLALRYPGIHMIIIRRTMPELRRNHIDTLRTELAQIARYNEQQKKMRFINGSVLDFGYCDCDSDLSQYQGAEFDVMFIDEATNLQEEWLQKLTACVRGVNDFPKRVYYTCNPGGPGHGYIKRLFIDREYKDGEDAADYAFIQANVLDNPALMKSQPDYIRQLQALPPKLRKMWLDGEWDIFAGQFFEDLRLVPDAQLCAQAGITKEEALQQRRFTHVIEPFDIPREWKIYRSYDFGYAKPFSCAWWAVDFDGCLYRIMELYGCDKDEPNEGLHWTPDKQFEEIARIEREHPWLKGKDIRGVADPAIWDESRGESIYETAVKHRVFFTKGDNQRIPGWMQVHYRLAFDEEGYPQMYVFSNCKGFIRTMPLLMYDEHIPEDIDTDLEDHIADEVRYFCMSRPIKPRVTVQEKIPLIDPLNQFAGKRRLPGGLW